jgi:Protein of unknown function (DUF2510)
MSSTPVTAVPPGWYPDPQAYGLLRWYSGIEWTAHTAPAPVGIMQPVSPEPDRILEFLLPVNRSGLAIAAGYAGLFSILLVFAPVSLLLGILAVRDLSARPGVGGRGRAWFGLVAGGIGTVILLGILLSHG